MEKRIRSDLKSAILAHDETKVSTLRILISEINNAVIAKGTQITDDEVVSVIQREIKKRAEAAIGFRKGNREDQAAKEELEAKILTVYLPTQLTDEELTKIVEEVITESGASSISSLGQVIGQVMNKVGSRATGARVSALAKIKIHG